MKKHSYYPTTIGGQIVWLGNYAVKIETTAASLGIPPVEATTSKDDALYAKFLLEKFVPLRQADAQTATAYRNDILYESGPGSPLPVSGALPPPAEIPDEVAPGALDRIFAMVSRIKRTTGYTDPIGESLLIIGQEMPVGIGLPKFAIKIVAGKVIITFVKRDFLGVYIESRRQGEEDWKFLATPLKKPFTDERPSLHPGQAEWREYRMRYWNGTPVGDWSVSDRIAMSA
jgi:hypothetical protein